MSIFSQLNESDRQYDGGYEADGGDFEPIPRGTEVKAMVEDADWQTHPMGGDDYINLKWRVVDGEYNNRVIFQKIRVAHPKGKDQQKKAQKMLWEIDGICGGHIGKMNGAPTDGGLCESLCHKPMALKLDVWKITTQEGDQKTGNWVKAVSPLSKPKAAAKTAPDLDDDIPF